MLVPLLPIPKAFNLKALIALFKQEYVQSGKRPYLKLSSCLQYNYSLIQLASFWNRANWHETWLNVFASWRKSDFLANYELLHLKKFQNSIKIHLSEDMIKSKIEGSH